MKIGGTYRLRDVGWRQCETLATSVGVDGDELIERARGMANALPDALSDVAAAFRTDGGSHSIVTRLESELVSRATRVAAE